MDAHYLKRAPDFDLSTSEIENSNVGGGLDGGIDSVVILINDKYISTLEELGEIVFSVHTSAHIFILQVKYENSFNETVIDKFNISMPLLLNLELSEDELLARFNPALVEKIIIFRKVWRECASKGGTFKISFIYVTKANEVQCNSSFESKIEQLIALVKQSTNQQNVGFKAYSAKEILDLYQKPRTTTQELKFKETPTTIEYNSKEKEYGYIGVITLDNFHSFIVNENGKVKETIFESNVRHFQGNVDVNKKIQHTIESDFLCDFWWLNNGINIIASESRLAAKSLYLENVQIVNGLQTSFILAEYYRLRENEKRSLLVKVVITKNKDTIDKIISASNSQTPVSASVLRATDDVQRSIELYFASQGYWYDRRKNFYKNLGKPSKRIFNIQNTAQAIEAILYRNPAQARSTPTTIVKDDRSYKRIFDPDIDFKTYLNCCLIHQHVSGYFRSKLPTDIRSQARNFSYHFGRTLASVITCKAEPSSLDIANINIENISL